MGHVSEPPALTAEERDWLSWARGIPASAREAARYREPSFNGARAAPKAEAEARELYDAQQSLTKARAAPSKSPCARRRRAHVLTSPAPHASRQAVMCAGDGGANPRKGDELLLHVTVRTADEQERLLSSTRAAAGGRDVPLRALLGDNCTLLRGVELSVAAFSRGERAVLQLPPEFAYGAQRVRLVTAQFANASAAQATPPARRVACCLRTACPTSRNCM